MTSKKCLIDANALKKTMYAFVEYLDSENLFIDVIIDAIDSYDPVDAVEVVRCKDCKKADELPHAMYCNFYDEIMDKADYCSQGERRTE